MAPILIDTNILVYVFDHNNPAKQDQAIRLLQHLELGGSGRLSTQCLAEFASVATRKLQPPLTAAEVYTQVERFMRAYPVLDLTPAVVLEAVRGVRDYRLAYYDAQLWAVARLNQIPVIFSEDFNSNSVIEGVRFFNPFMPDFDLNTWK
jgi:predicted nucleic acid-binding protein